MPRDDLLEEPADLLGVCRPSEGESAGDGRCRPGAAGDKQGVVWNRATRGGLGLPCSGIDAGQCPRREGRPRRRGQLGQVELSYLAEIERLGDRERPIPKVRLGREQLDGDQILRERPQSQGVWGALTRFRVGRLESDS